MCSGVGLASSSQVSAIRLPLGLCWVKGHCCLVQACQAVMAIDRYRSRHPERQASDKNRSVGGRRSSRPLACVPQGLCERRALTLFAEALRALSGLGFAPWVAEQRYPGLKPRSRLRCFVGDKEAEEGRQMQLGPAVHCEMQAHYKASVKRRKL